jgi:hypothetical protein
MVWGLFGILHAHPLIIRWLAFGYGGLVCAFGIYLVFGSRDIPLLFLPVYLPLFLLAGLLTIPYSLVMARYLTYKERRFVRDMKLADRVMDQQIFAEALMEERGTLIEEWSSLKGPVHYWWVDDNVTASSPHKWTNEGAAALISDDEYGSFSSWCHERYLKNGKAKLVASSYVPELRWRRPDSEPKLTIPSVAISAVQQSRREKARASKPS